MQAHRALDTRCLFDGAQNITVGAHVIDEGKFQDTRNTSINSKSPSPAFAIPSIPTSNSNPPQSRIRQILLPLPSHRLKRSSADFPRSKPKHTAAAQQLLSLRPCRQTPYKTTFSCFFLQFADILLQIHTFSFSLFFNQFILIFSVCESRISSFCVF